MDDRDAYEDDTIEEENHNEKMVKNCLEKDDDNEEDI